MIHFVASYCNGIDFFHLNNEQCVDGVCISNIATSAMVDGGKFEGFDKIFFFILLNACARQRSLFIFIARIAMVENGIKIDDF